MNKRAQFIEHLEMGLPQTLLLYGTSLSYHLAPLLRRALHECYGELLTVINSGMPAKASRSGLLELEERVLRHRPDALLLEFAVNDAYDYSDFPESTVDKGITLEESRSNLEAIISRVQGSLSHCEIMLQTMNPTYDSQLNQDCAGSRRPELGKFYEVAREVAVARSLKLIDNHAMWVKLQQTDLAQFETLVPDGAHPIPAAQRTVLAPFLIEQLTS